MRRDRPGLPETVASTPYSMAMIELFGGASFEGVSFSLDEYRAMEKVYSMDATASGEEAAAFSKEIYEKALKEYEAKMADPSLSRWEKEKLRKPAPPDLEGVKTLFKKGSQRNLMRYAREDGLRLMGVLSRYLESGEDPVKLVLRLMVDVGYDVPEDFDWICED